jgi:hypothetical protein
VFLDGVVEETLAEVDAAAVVEDVVQLGGGEEE